MRRLPRPERTKTEVTLITFRYTEGASITVMCRLDPRRLWPRSTYEQEIDRLIAVGQNTGVNVTAQRKEI